MMASFERELVTTVLEQNHFSLTKTAEQLKISRHALRYRMQRLNINAGTDTEEESATRPRDRMGHSAVDDLASWGKWLSEIRQRAAMGWLIFGSHCWWLLCVVFIWAACIRRKPRQRKYRYQHSAQAQLRVASAQDGAADCAQKVAPSRRRARRQRNPTLAETRRLAAGSEPQYTAARTLICMQESRTITRKSASNLALAFVLVAQSQAGWHVRALRVLPRGG